MDYPIDERFNTPTFKKMHKEVQTEKENLEKRIKRKAAFTDIRLNRKGTIGTEPIMKNGQMYTEIKLGRLGKIDIKNK